MSLQQEWHIPFQQDGVTLRAALATVPVSEGEIPLMIRLQRDPDLSFLGQLVFRAGLTRQQHDSIHILLGRGFLPMDQAFVLGFTIGCSKKAVMPEHRLHGEVGRHFCKTLPLFGETEGTVFKEGIKLAYMSFCAPLENFDFSPWQDKTLRELREAVGVEPDLLLAYYAVEKHRYPHSIASQRLLPTPAQVAGI